MKIRDEERDVGRRLPSEGWHDAEVTKFSWMTNEEGATTDNMQLTAAVFGDEDEGKGYRETFNMPQLFVREHLAMIVCICGVDQVLENQYKISPDATTADWAKKHLDPANPKCLKVLTSLETVLPGAKFTGYFSPDSFKGRDNQEVKTMRIAKWRKLGEGDEVSVPAPRNFAPRNFNSTTTPPAPPDEGETPAEDEKW